MTLVGDEDRSVRIETLDDVVFEKDGTPLELLQLKHHVRKASLTDSSKDLWKAIRVWSTHAADGRIDPEGVSLLLVTTESAPLNSIASLLRPNLQRSRDIPHVLERLERVARTSQNDELQPAFSIFLSLPPEAKQAVISSIHVIDQAPEIGAAKSKVKDAIKSAVSREHRNGLYERLEGWWFGRIVAQLRESNESAIAGFEVYDKIRTIAEQFGPSALPIDFLDAQPDSVDAEGDNRNFVQQLRSIAVRNRRIEKAIIDYYRAYEQRSRWMREQLLGIEEISGYEARLIDEWERYCDALADSADIASSSESDLRLIGRQVLNWMEQEADIRIRQDVIEAYVMRGSYHMLADEDEPRVWWHPLLADRLRKAIGRQELSN